MPGTELNVNPVRVITWFEDITIYSTFFNNNSPPPRQFLCNKILLKKISYTYLIEQIFELRGPGLAVYVLLYLIVFMTKQKSLKENFRLDCYLLKILQKVMYFISPYLGQIKQNLIPNCKILNVFLLKLQAKVGLNNLIFSNGFQC